MNSTHVVQQSGGDGIPLSLLQRQPSPAPTQQGKILSLKETSVDELERVGDAWHLKLKGFTEAGAVGRYIWPSGPPPGVQIAPLVVVEKPVRMGLFELTGVTFDALETMEPWAQKWFFDLGLRPGNPPGHPLHTIRLWFKAFIPQAKIRAPGYDCFKGDNRSYSFNPMAPARMHSEVLLKNLHTAAPTMTETYRCGLTRRIDCDSGALIASATADTAGMRFYNFRYPGAVVWDWTEPHPPAAHPPEITVGPSEPLSLDYIGAAADPLVSVAPFIDIWAHIELDLQSGFLTVYGKVDDYPAFEGYVTVNEKHGPFNIFARDGKDWVISLVGGANRPFSNTISLGSYAAMG